MTRIIALLATVAALISCGSLDSGHPTVDALLEEVCPRYDAICVADVVKEQLGELDATKDLYWGRFVSVSWEQVGVQTRAGVVCIESDRCALDLTRCYAVIMHEIGHLREGTNQIGADCWAYHELDDVRPVRDELVAFICEVLGAGSTRCITLRAGCPAE